MGFFSLSKKFQVAVVLLLSYAATAGAEQSYNSGYEPTPPNAFPARYKNYQILPGTLSPDQRYACIYPKRSILYELSDYSLFLVGLKPFHVLTQIRLGRSNLAAHARCYYASNWAKDSSAIVFIAGSRWGPEKVSLLQVCRGKVVKQVDLTDAVRRQVLPDMKRSGSQCYNEFYDFVFDSEERQTVSSDGYTTGERGWDIVDPRHVAIDCACTTDPKDLDPKRWAVRFTGVWDISRTTFVQKEFTRIPPRPLQ